MADRAVTEGDGMRLDLFAPGMTLLHKAGLAGLWMTLNGFEERRLQLKDGSWKLADRSIELHWTDRAAFFKSLFANSFKLTQSGLIWLMALGDPADNLQQAVIVHNAVLGTFLQHGKTRKCGSIRQPGRSRVIRVRRRNPRSALSKSVFVRASTRSCYLAKPIDGVSVPGWAFPGAVVRHVAPWGCDGT